MSEPPAPSNQPNSEPSLEQKNPKPSRAQVWRRRLRRTLLGVIVAAVILRVIIFFTVVPVIRKVAAHYGFDASFQRQELTLLGGDVGFWGMKVVPKSGGQPILQTDYIRGH